MTRFIAALVMMSLAVAGTTGCGGSVNGKRSKSARISAKDSGPRSPVKAAAQKDFESGLQLLRRGGASAPAAAKAKFESALRIDATLWEAWHNLGVIASQQNDDNAAATAFGKALALDAGNISSRLARAEALRRLNRVSDARTDYQAVLEQSPEDAPIRKDAAARLASLLRDAGKFDDAVEVLREVIRTTGASARIYTELGMIYLEQKRYELTSLVLAKAIELDAKEPAAYNALALLALRQGKGQEAFDRFDYAASLDPTYTDARYNKATVLLGAGDYARAKVELTKIVDTKSDDYGAMVALGIAERGLKNFPTAQSIWNNVVNRAAPGTQAHGDALFNMAILKLDFTEDPAGGKAALDRYMNESSSSHNKRTAAADKRKELK
jgi:tetratricopeptide (TPR) repeat protein